MQLLVVIKREYSCGKKSEIRVLKCQSYSRAYINFKQPEDVIEFAEFFAGHVFVNEKGTQFKTIVEYAPSQRVPKQWSKKDGREGTIDKGTAKEAPIITPLMDFVRQKRAAKGGPRIKYGPPLKLASINENKDEVVFSFPSLAPHSLVTSSRST